MPRPVPRRVQDGVPVLGPYSPSAVREAVALVRSLADGPVLRVAPPQAYLALYREGRVDEFPTDLVQVTAGTVLGPLSGSGYDFLLGTYGWGWSVIHSSYWIS